MLAPLDPTHCHALIPEWRGHALQISPLSGGITNTLHRVSLDDGRDFVWRSYGDGTEKFIDRDVEADNMRLLEKSAVTPRLFRYLPDHRVTVVEYVPGRSLSNPDFLDPSLLALAIAPIQRVHQTRVQLPRIFDPLVQVQRMYQLYRSLEIVTEDVDWPQILRDLGKVDGEAALDPCSYVPCHNDLLADNFILVDDGDRRDAPVFLIDWEYAGMSTLYYDLADMFQELLLPVEIEHQLMRCYFESDKLDPHLRLIELHRPFPDIYWALWSFIQLKVSSLDFDYASYGRSKLKRAQTCLQALRGDGLLP